MTTNQTLSQVRVINPVLTERVQGYKDTQFVWNLLFPPVPVTLSGGQILEFGDEAFRLYQTKRAPGAATVRANFFYTGKSYSLVCDAIEAPVPREHQRDAQVSPGIDLAERAAMMAMRVLNRQLEYDAAQLATTAANYATGNSVTVATADRWSVNTVDPVSALNTWRETVRGKIGIDPNVMVVGPGVYRALQTNDKMRDRVKYVSGEPMTEAMFARLFDVEVFAVGRGVYSSNTGPNNTPTFVDIWGKDVILAYVPQQATTMEEPSFGYTYTMVGHPLVEEPYYDNNTKTWYYGVTYERAPVISSNIAGFLAKGVVA